MINYNQILPELYVGSCPQGFDDIKRLKSRCNITAVLNLQTDEDLWERGLDWPALKAHYRNLHIHTQRIPMRDFDYDDQRRVLPKAVSALDTLLASGHTTYLHCNAGLGRSPLVAMAYFYWSRNLSVEKAIEHVEERRPCSSYEDLLEVSRQDLLRDDQVQNRISQRAFQLTRDRRNQARGPQGYWADAEREILREILGLTVQGRKRDGRVT